MVTEDAGSPALVARLLFIVSSRRSDLYAKLKVALAGEPSVEIHLDRRVGPRRSGAGVAANNLRRADRRQQDAIDAEIRDRGWAIVRLSPALPGRHLSG